jgi:isochorismate hydrolase
MQKELYYTTDNIDIVAAQYCAELAELSAKHHYKLNKNRTALLVIDMQDFFIDPQSRAFVPSVAAIIPKIKLLQNTFLQLNMPVFQTQHINDQNNGANMLKWWGSVITAKEPLRMITPELRNPDACIIKKTQYDAFFETELEKTLRQKKINQLVITGVMTHLCCETTARSAFIRGFENFFVVDGTATYNSALHRAALLNLAHGFAVPTLSSKLLKDLT